MLRKKKTKKYTDLGRRPISLAGTRHQSSEALYQLKPVTFRYKKEIDGTHALSCGLIAEEVAEVNADLIARDRAGKPETVRYEAVNAMLLTSS